MSFRAKQRNRVVVHLQDRDADGNIIKLTKDADAEQVDIRNIVKRYTKSGMISHVKMHQGFFADVSEAPTFMEALNVVANAQRQFELLPAKLRDRFGNDPMKFMDFVHERDADGNLVNADEMIKLGLREPKAEEPPPAPMKVEIVNPPHVPKS